MRRNERNKLFIAGGVFAGALAALIWWNVISIGQAIELTILFVLVCVTAIYAKRTAEIADATKEQAKATRKQAEASVKMAEAIAKPVVLPDFKGVTFPPGVIQFHNLGTGAALGGEIKVAYSPPDVVKRAWKERTGQYGSMAGVQAATWTILGPGKYHPCNPELTECNPGNIGTAFATYSDIYGRRFISGWGYRCQRDSSGRIILEPTERIDPLPEPEKEMGKNDS